MISLNREIMKNITSSMFCVTALSGALLVTPFQGAQAEPPSADFDFSEACRFSVKNDEEKPLMMDEIVIRPGDQEPPAELWIWGQMGNCPKKRGQETEKAEKREQSSRESRPKLVKNGCDPQMSECHI